MSAKTLKLLPAQVDALVLCLEQARQIADKGYIGWQKEEA